MIMADKIFITRHIALVHEIENFYVCFLTEEAVFRVLGIV